MSDQDKEIERTLISLAHSYDKPSDLLKAVRKSHPNGSKKQIVLAALSMMIDQAETDGAMTQKLHTLAMENRGDVPDSPSR